MPAHNSNEETLLNKIFYKLSDINSALGTTNLRTVVYTIGVAGTSGVDYTFTSVANTTEQSIQLGGTTIIPVKSPVIQLTAHCVTGLNGAITGTGELGLTSGSNTYMSLPALDDTDEMAASPIGNVISASATSVWFSFTPSANWDTITTGVWKIWITYIDNSVL